jgi:GAF domain-containing protein
MNRSDTLAEERISLPTDVRTWQQQLLTSLFHALTILGGLAVVGACYDAYASQVIWQVPVFIGVYVILLIVTFWHRVPYTAKAAVLLILLYGMAVFNLFISGQTGDGFPFLLTVPLMATLFLGRRMGITSLIVSTLTLMVFGWAFVSGQIVIPMAQLSAVDDLGSWVSRGLVFLMLALLLVLPQNYLFQRLVAALTQSRELATELGEHRASLEEQVKERMADLARRTRYLEATAKVAQDAASILDPQDLLSHIASVISQQFGFYHTGIFLVDPGGEWAVLQAASSEGGQRMLARQHRLKVGEEGIVGYVTSQGESHIALDTGTDAVHFDNPDLPATRSEMALPLRARGEIIGALDVQSTEAQAFSQEDAAVLQTLADQIAMAISNARLFAQAQESLEAERRAYGEMSRRSWREILRSQPNLGFVSNPRGVYALGNGLQSEMRLALRTGQPTLDENHASRLAVPVKVRGQIIGAVSGRKPDGAGEWTSEEIAVVEAMTEQLSLALESARLFQETQRRAARERLVGEITTHMRETLDVDTVLETAVREIGRALNIAEIEVRMESGERAAPSANGHEQVA